MSPRITAIVCTHNRAAVLRECLESLLRQTLDPAAYEIVVVDNASTDETPAVVAELKTRYPAHTVVMVPEPGLGLSRARNTGVREARAPVVAFADDDDIVPEHWLAHGVDLFDRLEALDGAGGPVFPRFTEGRPNWFPESYETSAWGAEPRYLLPGESFFGNNMMFRKDVLEELGGFSDYLGMSGTRLAYGEETLVYYRLWERDKAARFFYSPDLHVQHHIPRWKTSVSYRLRREFADGRAQWVLRPPAPGGTAPWMPLSVRAFAGVVRTSVRALLRIRRHGQWQRWAVEEVGPVAAAVGKLTWCLRIPIVVRQGPGT